MTIRLRVRELAEVRKLTLAQFQRKADLSVSTARRFWYSTTDGSENGEPLKAIRLDLIERIADFFGVTLGDLFMKE